MEKFMLKAHELQAQGFTQKQIAEQLGRTDWTNRKGVHINIRWGFLFRNLYNFTMVFAESD